MPQTERDGQQQASADHRGDGPVPRFPADCRDPAAAIR